MQPLILASLVCTRARCQTDIVGRGAAHWRGPPGRPEKAALDRYSGGRDSGLRPCALPDRYRGPRSSALAQAPGAPRKSGLGPLFSVLRTGPSPLYRRVS